MPNDTRRKVRWCPERMRAYVQRDGVRYWAPHETVASLGDSVRVLNPDTKSVTVCYDGLRETWHSDAT